MACRQCVPAGSSSEEGAKMTTNDNNDSKQVSESTYRELTEEQLNQITGGIIPSIPIPPPSPGIYAIGQIEARFPR
jgi:bacteriocin-like protein